MHGVGRLYLWSVGTIRGSNYGSWTSGVWSQATQAWGRGGGIQSYDFSVFETPQRIPTSCSGRSGFSDIFVFWVMGRGGDRMKWERNCWPHVSDTRHTGSPADLNTHTSDVTSNQPPILRWVPTGSISWGQHTRNQVPTSAGCRVSRGYDADDFLMTCPDPSTFAVHEIMIFQRANILWNTISNV